MIHDNQGEHFGVIPVHKALEESSDVGAIKMALKVGPDKFYQYIRGVRIWIEAGRGVAWRDTRAAAAGEQVEASSIGSIAMGQEIAVTPLQLVSMVSTIANGGVYLPPHVLMPGELDANPKDAAPMPVAEPIRSG